MDDTIGLKASLFAYFEHGVGEASKTSKINDDHGTEKILDSLKIIKPR